MIVVIYYSKERIGKNLSTISGTGKTRTYQRFFDLCRREGIKLYIADGKDKYLGRTDFKQCRYLKGSKLVTIPTGQVISCDAVFDLSMDRHFPPKTINHQVLPKREFKLLAIDKYKTYQYLKKYCPQTLLVKNLKDFHNLSKFFEHDEMVVLKPRYGIKGNGIIIDTFNKVKFSDINISKEYLAQKFIDSGGGIKELVNSRHDIRFLISGGRIKITHIRVPKKGKLLANVAQGASKIQINPRIIPLNILTVANKIITKINKSFYDPVYSLDFVVENEVPYLMEINHNAGFPSDEMTQIDDYLLGIIDGLKKVAQLK